MNNGLIMSIDEFRALPEKQKLDCLYLNQVKTLEAIRGYKLYYRVTTIIGSVLVAGMCILFKMHIGV
jgi:hypothetical protein